MPNQTRAIVQGDYIGSCNETLVNKCQCKRPASWIVLNEDGSDSPFQMCNRCKVLAENGIMNAPILPVTNTGTMEAILPPPASPETDPVTTEGTEGAETNVLPDTPVNVPSTPDSSSSAS